MYKRLRGLQGTTVPVCVGIINLEDARKNGHIQAF